MALLTQSSLQINNSVERTWVSRASRYHSELNQTFGDFGRRQPVPLRRQLGIKRVRRRQHDEMTDWPSPLPCNDADADNTIYPTKTARRQD